MRYLKIYVIIPIFTLILVFCLPPKNANSDNSNETVIADVDGNPITLAELRLAINSLPVDYQQMAKTSMSQMMLQQLIDLKLFSVKADVDIFFLNSSEVEPLFILSWLINSIY